jgi:hypothetical protein
MSKAEVNELKTPAFSNSLIEFVCVYLQVQFTVAVPLRPWAVAVMVADPIPPQVKLHTTVAVLFMKLPGEMQAFEVFH